MAEQTEEQELHLHFTAHLSWEPELSTLIGRSALLQDIDVFVDFAWDAEVGHPQRTFTNYKSLKGYVRQNTKSHRRSALLLTNQSHRPEGCVRDHSTHDIFIVNIHSYKGVAKNDAAGAYFAGLQGSQIFDPSTMNTDKARTILASLTDLQWLSEWIKEHPDRFAYISKALDHRPLKNADTDLIISELSERVTLLSDSEQQQLATLLAIKGFPTAALQAADLARRRAAAEEFKTELDRDEWLEGDWQKFFQREEWIFGHGLLYHFLQPITAQAHVGNKDIENRGGNSADYAVRTTGKSASFIALVEIKTPSAKLVGPMYRNGIYGIHEELSSPISQIISSCDVWNRSGSKDERNILRSSEDEKDHVV